MQISLYASIGKRGQFSREGRKPWQNDYVDLHKICGCCTLVCGTQTFARISARIIKQFENREMSLIAWNPSNGDLVDFLDDMENIQELKHLMVIGGVNTFKAFQPFINHEVIIERVDYDCDKSDDVNHTFFPTHLFEQVAA